MEAKRDEIASTSPPGAADVVPHARLARCARDAQEMIDGDAGERLRSVRQPESSFRDGSFKLKQRHGGHEA